MKRQSARRNRFASNRHCRKAMPSISQPPFTLFSKLRSEFSEGPYAFAESDLLCSASVCGDSWCGGGTIDHTKLERPALYAGSGGRSNCRPGEGGDADAPSVFAAGGDLYS